MSRSDEALGAGATSVRIGDAEIHPDGSLVAPDGDREREALLHVRARDVIDRLASLVGELAPRTRRVQDIAAVVHEGLGLFEPREVSIDDQVEAAARAMARANDDGCFEEHDAVLANADLLGREGLAEESEAGFEDRVFYREMARAGLMAIPIPPSPSPTGGAAAPQRDLLNRIIDVMLANGETVTDLLIERLGEILPPESPAPAPTGGREAREVTSRDARLMLGALAGAGDVSVDQLADSDLDGAIGRLRALATSDGGR